MIAKSDSNGLAIGKFKFKLVFMRYCVKRNNEFSLAFLRTMKYKAFCYLLPK